MTHVLWRMSIAIVIAGYVGLADARADEAVTLRFAIPGGSLNSSTYTTVFQPWMAKVEADSAGRLKLQPFFTIANFANVYERVMADWTSKVLSWSHGKPVLLGLLQRKIDVSVVADFQRLAAIEAVERLGHRNILRGLVA